MSDSIHIDYETFSECNLKLWGQYKYASHESTEILMAAVSLNDEEPLLYIPEAYTNETTFSDPGVFDLLGRVNDPDVTVYAHNAPFEIAVTKYCWDRRFPDIKAPELKQWRCTRAMAYRAGLPVSLADVGRVLKLDMQKDKKGTDLIAKFSIPQKDGSRIMPWDEPAAFREFADYCLQDVRSEQAIYRALKRFAEPDLISRKSFYVHCRINDRGIPVNVDALHKAHKLVVEGETRIVKRFRELTGGLNPTQREKVLAWLQIYGGYPYANLQAGSIEDAFNRKDWGDEVTREALSLRRDQSYAATKKLATMIACDCGDGYVRGTLEYHGAIRTGRTAGRLIQPQNFRRPTFKETGKAYQMIIDGCTCDELEMVFGPTIETIASCIRHFLQPHDGKKFYGADYASIEARIVAWLAGQDDAVEEFRTGADRYIKMAAKIFKVKESSIGKDSLERFIGQQTILGCGFQMWWPAFQSTCLNYGQQISDEMAQLAVTTFREANPKIKALWGIAERAALAAIRQPNSWFAAGPHLKMSSFYDKDAKMNFLHTKLPSGRLLSYPNPRIVMVQKYGKRVPEIRFDTPEGVSSTYGGKLVENATQATAGDFMMNGAFEAEKQGFEIVLLVHDEAIAHEHPTLSLEQYCQALQTLPSWAKDFPLVAEGKTVPYYTK